MGDLDATEAGQGMVGTYDIKRASATGARFMKRVVSSFLLFHTYCSFKFSHLDSLPSERVVAFSPCFERSNWHQPRKCHRSVGRTRRDKTLVRTRTFYPKPGGRKNKKDDISGKSYHWDHWMTEGIV